MQETIELNGTHWREGLADIERNPDIEGIDVLRSAPTSGTLRLTVRGCPFPRLFADHGVVPSFPLDVHAGAEEWPIVANEGEANALLTALRERGVQAQVVRSGPYEPKDVLTKRQREILDRALEEGYYSYPRRITLTRLAEKLGIAKSTLSEILMVVERQLMGPHRPQDRTPPAGLVTQALSPRALRGRGNEATSTPHF